MSKRYEETFNMIREWNIEPDTIKKSLALGLFLHHEISLGKLGEIYGLGTAGMLEWLREKGILSVWYTQEHLEEDMAGVEELMAKKIGRVDLSGKPKIECMDTETYVNEKLAKIQKIGEESIKRMEEIANGEMEYRKEKQKRAEEGE